MEYNTITFNIQRKEPVNCIITLIKPKMTEYVDLNPKLWSEQELTLLGSWDRTVDLYQWAWQNNITVRKAKRCVQNRTILSTTGTVPEPTPVPKIKKTRNPAWKHIPLKDLPI